MVVGVIVRGAKSLLTPFIQPIFIPLLYWTLSSLGTIFSVWTNGDRIQDENDFLNPLQPTPYDFIIVGAGSAGCMLANRLSRRHTVLLVEAGGEPNPLQFIPGLSLLFPNYPDVDWQHKTVPQRYGSLLSVNGEAIWSTGKGLGGSGTLNYMIHLRGHRKDFDNWANITGDPSWSWEGVLPYFKSYEDYEIPGDTVNHGYGGDLRIEAPDHPQSAFEFVRAAEELGYPNVDLNAPFTEGFDIVRYPILRGVRQAPYKGLLEPIRNRATLTIMKFAQVNKILFKNGNVAYGVEYDRHGKTYVAHARREVIVSAGTMGSPKLLMLSGVGPSPHLQDLNINVVADLPVGNNLHDHLSVYLAPFYIRPGLGYYLDRDLTIGQFVKWFTLGRGRLTSTGSEASGLFSTSINKARGQGDWPDIHLFSYGITNFRDAAQQFSRIFNLKFDDMQKYMRNDVGKDSLYLFVTGARPVSRGYIQLGGSSPYDKLIIDPNYLGDPGKVDLKVLLEGVKKSLFLMENTTAGGVTLGARFTTERLPGCEHLEFRSDAYWICFIRRYSVTLRHPVGTCSMGSVVDSQLRVIGTKNLRVIDASIQPTIVLTNTQASTLMIAEKGADMILRDWDQQQKNINHFRGKKEEQQFGLIDESGVGNKKGNDFWLSNKKRSDVILEGNFGGAKTSQKIKVKGRNKLPYQDFEYRPIQHVPNLQNVSITKHETDEQLLQKVQHSIEQLKEVSKITSNNYNSHLLEQHQKQPMITTTTTTTTTQKTTIIKLLGRNQEVTPENSTSPNEVKYYDDDEGYASGEGTTYEEDSPQTTSSPPLAPTTISRIEGNYY